MNQPLYLERETYAIIGKCMAVHRYLGHGFLEVVYKDALEYEFSKAGIPYAREVRFEVEYKTMILPHYYFADFTVFHSVILEIKSMDGLHKALEAQLINYLKVSQYKVGLLVNFGKQSLEYERRAL